MAVTNVRGRQLRDDDVFREDLNTTITSRAVIRKAVSGTGIALSSTGVDAGTGDVTINLAASGVTANTYGSASQIPVVTVDTYGRITAVSLATVSGGSGGTTVRYSESFTAIANQTVFTTTNTLLAGYYDVYLNGVRLNTSSYSTVDNSITLVDGAAVGDIVDVIILGNLSVATTLPSQTGNAGKYLTTDGTNISWATVTAGGSGTVTSVSVASANGFAGTVATATSTPAITLSTTITGLLKGNGTAISAASAGTDYQAPSANLSSLSGLSYVSASFVKMTAAGTFALDTNTYATTSSLSSYVPYTGAAANVNLGIYNLTNTGSVTTNSVTSTTLFITEQAGGTYNFAAGTTAINVSSTYVSFMRSATQRFSFVYPAAIQSYTLPAANGTIALTSDLAGFGSGTVTSVSVTTANGVSGTVATATSTPAITITLGAITPTSVNGLTFTAATTGFTIAGGTTSKTLTVSNTLTLAGTDSSTLNIGAGGTLGSAAFTASTAYQASNTNLTSLAGLTFASTSFVKMTAAGTFALDTNTYYLASNPSGYTNNTGTVTTVSVTTANGVSGTVATAGTTPAITLTLGAITPTSVNSVVISGSTTPTLAVTGTSSISGSNTGDNAANSLYSGLVSNATHTGDATGATSLTVVGLRGVVLPALGASAGFLRYTGTGTNTWVFDTATYLTANQSISVTGDVTGSGTTSIALTLATVNSNTGTFNNVTVNAKGLVTAASNVAYLTANQSISFTPTGDISSSGGAGATSLTPAITNIGLRGVALPTLGASAGFLRYTGTGTNTWVFDSSTYLTANQSISVTGDATGSGSTSIALTLATVNSNTGTFNNVTVNAKGLVTAANNVAYITGNQSITLSGDISGTGATAITTAIGANKVTNAMLAQVVTGSFLGRVTAATGNVETLTGTQATTLLDVFSSTLKGLAPASGGGTTTFLRADGTWAAPAGSSQWTTSSSDIYYTTGNVGIGATSPVSFGANWRSLHIQGQAATIGGAIRLSSSDSSLVYDQFVSNGLVTLQTTTNTPLVININSVERFRLKTTGQLQLANYTATGSFTGTAAGILAFDASGNILTLSDSNFYSSNGTLTSDRTISAGGFTLTIGPATTFSTTVGISGSLSTSAGVTHVAAANTTTTGGVVNVLSLATTYANPYDSSIYIGARRTDIVDNGETAGYRIFVSNTGAAHALYSLQRASSATGANALPTTYTTISSFLYTGQLVLSNYTTSTSFSGTPAGYLAFDSSGNVITVTAPTGGSAYSVTSVSTTYSETATSGTKIIKATTAGGTFVITLPTAVGNTATIIIKKTAGTATLTVDGAGTETIDGGLTADIIKVDESITLVSDNSNWLII